MTEQPMTQLVRSPGGRLKRRVAWAERLLYAALTISVIRLSMAGYHGASTLGLTIWSTLIAGHAAVIWITIRRRRLWACWLLLAYFLGFICFTVLGDAFGSQTRGWIPPDRVTIGLRFFQMVMQGTALFLLFSKNGRRWFTGPSCSNGFPPP